MEQVTISFWVPVLCLPHEGGHACPLPTGASKGPYPRAEDLISLQLSGQPAQETGVAEHRRGPPSPAEAPEA